LQVGIVSNQSYVSPETLVFEHHGWISATPARCSAGLAPPPCWDILLTPSGVDTIRPLVPSEQADRSSLEFPVARRELVGVHLEVGPVERSRRRPLLRRPALHLYRRISPL
jgi:hypothetical protein